jgi:hypothetical protein
MPGQVRQSGKCLHFAKKMDEGYPEKLPVYLKNAFLSGAYVDEAGILA